MLVVGESVERGGRIVAALRGVGDFDNAAATSIDKAVESPIGRAPAPMLATWMVGTVLRFGFGDVVLSQDGASQIAPRPFPVAHVTLGDKLLAIPQPLVASKTVTIRDQRESGGQPYVSFVNADLPQFPRTDHFPAPALSLSLSTWYRCHGNCRNQICDSNDRELENRWPSREPDEHGFWHWKTAEFVSVADATDRPLGQPLIVQCRSATPEPKRSPRRSMFGADLLDAPRGRPVRL